jgi:hypothetical protein
MERACKEQKITEGLSRRKLPRAVSSRISGEGNSIHTGRLHGHVFSSHSFLTIPPDGVSLRQNTQIGVPVLDLGLVANDNLMPAVPTSSSLIPADHK